MTMTEWLTYPFTDDFLLPENVTYDDFVDPTGEREYVQRRHVALMPVYGAFILLARTLYERHVAKRWSAALGIRERRCQPQAEPNEHLEAHYRTREKRPDAKALVGLAKRVDWDERRTRRWFRRRRNADRPSLTRKFAETSWRLVFYTFAFAYGMTALAHTPWLYRWSDCWRDFPLQPMWPSIHYYYMLEGGFYMSLLFSLGVDNRRKDFAEQVLHHLATIGLIAFSYAANFIRVGSLVMAIHDVSDILLEAAKCAHYAERRRLADNLFTLFAVVFIITRLVLFPRVVLYTTLVDSLQVSPPYSGYYFFNLLLFVLQCLHLFWAATILRMAYKMAAAGGVVQKDDRSDVEELTTTDDDDDQ